MRLRDSWFLSAVRQTGISQSRAIQRYNLGRRSLHNALVLVAGRWIAGPGQTTRSTCALLYAVRPRSGSNSDSDSQRSLSVTWHRVSTVILQLRHRAFMALFKSRQPNRLVDDPLAQASSPTSPSLQGSSWASLTQCVCKPVRQLPGLVNLAGTRGPLPTMYQPTSSWAGGETCWAAVRTYSFSHANKKTEWQSNHTHHPSEDALDRHRTHARVAVCKCKHTTGSIRSRATS